VCVGGARLGTEPLDLTVSVVLAVPDRGLPHAAATH